MAVEWQTHSLPYEDLLNDDPGLGHAVEFIVVEAEPGGSVGEETAPGADPVGGIAPYAAEDEGAIGRPEEFGNFLTGLAEEEFALEQVAVHPEAGVVRGLTPVASFLADGLPSGGIKGDVVGLGRTDHTDIHIIEGTGNGGKGGEKDKRPTNEHENEGRPGGAFIDPNATDTATTTGTGGFRLILWCNWA